MNDPVERARRTAYAIVSFGALGAIFAGFVFVQPDIAAAMERLNQDRGRLHSDDVVFATEGAIERVRARLISRHRSLVEGGAQSSLLHSLALVARRHSVHVVVLDVAADPASAPQRRSGDVSPEQLHLRAELRGDYRALLSTIDELALVSDAVQVEAPSLRRDGSTLDASVPIAILRPRDGGERSR